MPVEAIKAVAEAPAETIKAVTGLIDSVGVKDLVQLGVSMTNKGVEAGTKAYAKKSEERSALVEVPEMYSNDYRLKLDDAKRWLEEDGLRAESVIVQPNVAYKDCSDMEVVATNFKLKKKVKPGTRIILRYVTLDVIEASKELFIEAEKKKAEEEHQKLEAQTEKDERKSEKAKKNRESLDKTVGNIQDGLTSAVKGTRKGFDGFLSKIPRKEKKDTTEDV